MEKKSKKGIIGIILVLIVIIGCVMAYAYVKTDIFKSPQQLFKKYLANNVSQLKEANLNPLDEILTKMETEPVETNFDMEIESEEENINVNVNSKSDATNQKNYSAINITSGDKKYFNLELLLSNNTLGIQIDELHDKYLALENRDLKNVAETLEFDEETIAEIPNKINVLENSYTEEKQKFEELKDKYLEKLDSQISEDRYQAEKNVQIQVNGKDIAADKYTLTLGNKETLKISNSIFSELLNDPDFILLYEKNGNTEELESLKEEIIIPEEEIEKMEDTEVKISVYESNSKTVKTEIIVGDDSIEFFVDNNTNESTISLVANDAKDEDIEVGEKMSLILKNKYENQIGIMTVQISNEHNKDDVKELQESQDETWSSYYDDEYYAETYKDENYELTLTTEKKDENNMSTTISTDSINNLFEEEEQTTTVNKCEISYMFNSELDIPDFSEENSLILNDYTQEDFEGLANDILENAYNNASEYPDSIISLFVNYYIYMTQLNSQSSVLSEPNLDAGYYN